MYSILPIIVVGICSIVWALLFYNYSHVTFTYESDPFAGGVPSLRILSHLATLIYIFKVTVTQNVFTLGTKS